MASDLLTATQSQRRLSSSMAKKLSSKDLRPKTNSSSLFSDYSPTVSKSYLQSQKDKPLYWNIRPPQISANLENRRWHEVQLDFARLNQAENTLFVDKEGCAIDVKPITEPKRALDFVMERYIRFCRIAKKLDECYRYLVHPQKRELLRACLSSVLVRILELKNEMVQIDLREYHFFEDILQDPKWTYDQVDLNIPIFIREERSQVLKNREKILTCLYKKSEAIASASRLGLQEVTKKDAILLIQRQTRFYFGNIKMATAQMVLRPRSPESIKEMQRRVIRKWMIYISSKHIQVEREATDQLLRIVHKQTNRPLLELDPLAIRNRNKALQLEEDYRLDKVTIENYLYQTEGPSMAWSFKYTIMQWLLETRDALGQFPPFPTAEEGGSSLIFSNMTVQEVRDELDANFESGKTYMKLKRPKEKKKKAKKKPQQKFWILDEFAYNIEETDCMREMKDQTCEYRDYWYYNDDNANITQKHDKELIEHQMRPFVAEKIRLQVDELIRNEMDNLLYAIDRVPRKNKESAKKKKSSVKRGGKSDSTADPTVEELFKELVIQGIIIPSPSVKLKEFIGEKSLSGAAMDNAGKDPLPALGDIRRMITEFAILPLSSKSIHKGTSLIRKLLIAGVRDTGKRLLVNTVCHEIGATMFDLTPSNLEGKYDSLEERKMLMHLIIKVGKAMEPSVFLVEDCEKMFLKKKDKADSSKPHQWAKPLNKALKKGIKNGDRMMLIGTSSQPYLTKQKKFNKYFDRILIVPHPDYSSRYHIWRHFISQTIKEPLPPYFHLSSLTKVTAGYTVGAIKATCEEVLTQERISQFVLSPLQPTDFIHHIWKYDPIYREEVELFTAWYRGTPLAKERIKKIHTDEEEVRALRTSTTLQNYRR